MDKIGKFPKSNQTYKKTKLIPISAKYNPLNRTYQG